jgi:lipoprotein-anchoring transpeptidase ErfK/SrfK
VPTNRSLRLLLLSPAVALVALATACGGSTGTAEPAASAPAAEVVEVVEPANPAAAPEPTLVARPAGDTPVFETPGATAPAQTLRARSEFGSPLALVVVDEADGWLEVQLPTRPNESTGWIRAAGVEIREVDLAVHVDLAERRLRVTDGDVVVVDTPIAVGAPGTPTPTGTFFVVDKLATDDDAGPYGPFALGLSAHSEVLTEFAGGDGQVGIHGTNDPSSIGRDVSNGCIRVPNDVTAVLEDLLPLGTPVTVA